MRFVRTFLLGMLMLVLGTGPGMAATTVPITTELFNCYEDCTSRYAACNDGCCGILFCGKSCLSGCRGNLVGCRASCETFCSTCSPDGAFFATATLAAGGRTIRVGGPLACPPDATAEISVTLTQSEGGAIAMGATRVHCPASETSFAIDAHATDGTKFLPLATAQACATARVHAADRSLDSFQWCRDLPLVPEGVELED